MNKEERHKILYDFKNACPVCREPAISYWQGNMMGYSIPRINHKENCEFRKKEQETASKIFKSIPKKWLKF